MPKAADTVSYWFAERMATGPVSRDDAAHAQAVSARDDLVKRLASPTADAGAVVGAWFTETIATGAIASNTAAYNQAFAARDDLIGRLAAAANDIPSAPKSPAAKPKPKPKAKAKAPAKAAADLQPAAPAKADPATQA